MDILNSTDMQGSTEKTLLKQYEHKICSGKEKELRSLTLKLVRLMKASSEKQLGNKHSHDRDLLLYPFREFANCCSPTII